VAINQFITPMPEIFNALPGQEVPVGGISKALARMWAGGEDAIPGKPGDGEAAKATQVNFVLHLGYHTTSEDAARQFQIAVEFSRRYPCRVVVLCPMRNDEPGVDFRAKIYGECTPGKTRGDMRCCEFVMLSYPMASRRYLEDQVSVCLSTDLPLYYWAHNFSSSARLKDYHYLLSNSKRVLFDNALTPVDVAGFVWPKPEVVRDLAYARLLRVRQAIGQFLSGFTPAVIVDGLKGMAVRHGAVYPAEARGLAEWGRTRLLDCGASAALSVAITAAPELAERDLEMVFEYTNGQCFAWRGDMAKGCAQFRARIGGAKSELSIAISLLDPAAALAEAMFF
jgi:Glucose-6-phosphate dehydrogenase subunit